MALLSDTHIAGPEYPLNTETGPLDNAAVTRTQQRLWRAVRAVNAISPAVDLVLFGGDVVHNGMHHLRDLGLNAEGMRALLTEPVNGFKIARALMSQLTAPPLYVWGNHDALVECGDPASSPSRQLMGDVYQRFFNAKPYASRDVGPWKVVALNSMQGYTWDAASERCNPLLSSYGEEQLRWLHAELAQGKHTLVMTHFPLSTSVLGEVDAQQGWRDLATVLSSHPNVRLALSGHFHKGLSWEGLYPFPALILPAVRYNPQNFALLELHPDGTFTLPDAPKNRGGARCSDWWTYRGQPRFEGRVEAQDGGDCGVPAAGEEAWFVLQPVLNRSSIPSLEVFNPETSCQFALATAFLEACADGASPDCCDVLADVSRLSSSAPFSTCFCHPAFWQEAVDYMDTEHGVDLAATLGSCITEHGKLLVFRGGPLTWCPAAAADVPP